MYKQIKYSFVLLPLTLLQRMVTAKLHGTKPRGEELGEGLNTGRGGVKAKRPAVL
jgi:hypothetical protein